MSLLFRLLSKNTNWWLMACYTVAGVLGAMIVIAGLQAWRDIRTLYGMKDSFIGTNYVVITKPVSSLTTVITAAGGQAGFTENEKRDLEQIPGVTGVGGFTSAQFSVYGMLQIGSRAMQTQMFLESVPDRFVDLPDGCRWEAQLTDRDIPVIVPQTYINLYNYGYATSTGMPQVDGSLISQIPLNFIFSGRGNQQLRYRARIVAYTQRLNTILVPDAFLKEANARLSYNAEPQMPSRMIVCTDSKKLSPQLISQLQHDGYEIEGNAADQLRMQTLLYGICTAIIVIGLIVSLLSFLLLVTSIMIVVEKNRQKIENLSLIGYGRQSIALTYQLLAAAFDCITWFMGALLSTAFYPLFSSLLHAVVPTFMPMSILSAWLPAIILATAFTLLHALIVRHLVGRVVK